jgi:predicted dienelactone hydrolase
MKTPGALRARLGAATALAAVGLAGTGASAASAALPGTSGHPVGVTQIRLVDHARTDPWTHTGRREVVVSAFYPAWHEPRSPARYFSPALADAIAAGFQMPAAPLRAVRSHAGTDIPARNGRHPVVLVIPGAGLFRSSVTLVAEDLAAHGYVALAIDHPGDAAATEQRRGKIRPIAPEFLADLAEGDVRKAVRVRIADVRFVLDRLQAIDRRRVLRHRLDRTRIAIVGHSIGGSTAANVMLVDRRVDVAVNYDGDYFLAAAERAPARPLMTMTGGADDNQRNFFARQQAGGLLVTLAGAQHESFTDLSYLGSLINGPVYPVETGTIAPAGALAAQRAYTRAFLAHHLLGRPASRLLTRRTSARYPAVTVRSPASGTDHE